MRINNKIIRNLDEETLNKLEMARHKFYMISPRKRILIDVLPIIVMLLSAVLVAAGVYINPKTIWNVVLFVGGLCSLCFAAGYMVDFTI